MFRNKFEFTTWYADSDFIYAQVSKGCSSPLLLELFVHVKELRIWVDGVVELVEAASNVVGAATKPAQLDQVRMACAHVGLACAWIDIRSQIL